MSRFTLFLLAICFLTACGHTYYIVRHTEKAQPPGAVMSTPNDPPLSREGEERAMALKDVLKNKHIGAIFTTNTLRTRSTAGPLGKALQINPEVYKAADAAFIATLKGLKKNVLIVGHSNTVDDIANGLSNQTKIKADLPDWEYDNLYLVKYRGNKIRFEARKYGKPSGRGSADQ